MTNMEGRWGRRIGGSISRLPQGITEFRLTIDTAGSDFIETRVLVFTGKLTRELYRETLDSMTRVLEAEFSSYNTQ